MFVLLTTLFIAVIGKILCEVQVSQEIKYQPSPFLPGRTTLPVNYHWTSASPQTFQFSPKITEKSVVFVNKNNVSATTQQPAANKNQQKRRLFISRHESRNMDNNRPFVNPATTNNRNSTSAQNNTKNSTRDENKTKNAFKVDDIYDKVMFEDDPPMEINFDNSGGPATRNSRNGSSNTTGAVDSVTQATPPVNMTQPPPAVNVTQAPSPVNVTLEDRSSFDGDACPRGYVRVNGMCVMPD